MVVSAGPIGTGADIEFGWTSSIPSYAFAGMDSLDSVVIPNGVSSIDSYAFQGCTALESVTVPESVTGIGTYAFNGCTALASLTIPGVLNSAGSNAFTELADPSVIYVKSPRERELITGKYSRDRTTVDILEHIDITSAEIERIPAQTYTGVSIEPPLTVKLNGSELVVGKDYTVAYSDNTEPGIATATVTGIGDYRGEKSITFKIVEEHAHQYSVLEKQDATCTEEGWIEYQCDI